MILKDNNSKKNPENSKPQIKLLNDIIENKNQNEVNIKNNDQKQKKKNTINAPLKKIKEPLANILIHQGRKQEIVNAAYDGDISDKVNISSLEKKNKIHPLINDSKFNVFFIVSFFEKNIKYTDIATFVDKTGLFSISDTIKNFNNYIIYENQSINTKKKKLRVLYFKFQ